MSFMRRQVDRNWVTRFSRVARDVSMIMAYRLFSIRSMHLVS